jgi:hypothetical protein
VRVVTKPQSDSRSRGREESTKAYCMEKRVSRISLKSINTDNLPSGKVEKSSRSVHMAADQDTSNSVDDLVKVMSHGS